MQSITIRDLDIIYISYDEPNCEYNWADLQSKIPWAKRVHGVKGSDSAHKAAANLSDTDRFITVDGDNILYDSEDFLNQEITINNLKNLDKVVISWPSINAINGLIYGNGGIKCWSKKAVLEMRTHESADISNLRAQIDFCWELEYQAIDRCFSTIKNNASNKQAWRSGFREGIKMCLNDGYPVNHLKNIAPTNLRRLKIWMTVGYDDPVGIYSIFGALQGCYYLRFKKWNFISVRDFDMLDEIWEQIDKLTFDEFNNTLKQMQTAINDEIFVPNFFSAEHSKFIKDLNFNQERQFIDITTDFGVYDIVMITYHEDEAEENWKLLSDRFPRAKRVNGVKGIHNAHKHAASLCRTEMFWVVDGDAKVFDNFDFDYIVPKTKRDTVHVWRARNPVNGLEYGYGGIKLLPRLKVLNMDTTSTDMTTSISDKYKPIFECASLTAFDTSPESTWRSAFRECAKLSGSLIKNADKNTEDRLRIWTTVGNGKFSKYSIAGANSGVRFIADNPNLAYKINDFEFLHEMFLKDDNASK